MKHKLENGIHDIPNDIYHSSEGISRTGICEFKRSPLHYWNRYLNPDRIEQKKTKAMKLGELVHALVLEPEHFAERYVLAMTLEEIPPQVRLKDVGREQFEQVKAARKQIQERNNAACDELKIQAEGREIITWELYEEASKYADAVLSQDVAKSLFSGMQVEKSIYFTHKQTGLQCKVRPDAWAGSIVTDLKTCKDASYSAFQSDAYREGYFIQAGMIKQALESIDIEIEKFVFYCVEKTPAMACVYYPLNHEDLERGEKEFDNLMYGVEHCINNNRWNSYPSRILTYPKWAREDY